MRTSTTPIIVVAVLWATSVTSCLLGGIASCMHRRRKARKEEKMSLRTEGDPTGDFIEPVTILGNNPTSGEGLSPLRPQRRAGPGGQINRTAEQMGQLVQQSNPISERVPESRAPEEPGRSDSLLEERVRRAGVYVVREAGDQVSDSMNEMNPLASQPPVVRPGIHPAGSSGRARPSFRARHRQASSTVISGSASHFVARMGSRSTHRHTSSTVTRTSRASTMYTDSTHPVSTLPSYPGTVRSVSPPPYSDLWRARSRGAMTTSSREGRNYIESVMEPLPNLWLTEK